MLLVSIGMIASGIQGVPRRHYDISFAQALFPAEIPGTVGLTLAIFGIGALIAVVGGAMFLTIVLASVLTTKTQEARSTTLMIPAPQLAPLGAHEEHPEPKGTFVIVLVFLLFFIVYYFANWWLLSGKWLVQ